MSRWYRAYEGTVTDAKLGEVALVAECSRSVAIAAWHCLLESAAATNDGGRFDTTPRRVAVILGEAPSLIERVWAEMEALGMIDDGSVAAWTRRQYESDSSTERSRKHRERKRNADATLQGRSATPPEAETDTDSDIKNEDKPHSSARDPEATETESERLLQQAALEVASQQPISEAVSAWNAAAAVVGWPAVAKMTDKRRAHVRNRLREHQIQGWRDAIARARASPFLAGSDPPSWFTFDWIAKPENFLKVIEGNYDRRSSGLGRSDGPDRRNALARAADRHLGLLGVGGGNGAGEA